MLLVRVLTHRLFLASLLLTFTLGAGAEPVAQAIWCSGNTTLYLTYSETQYSTDGPNNTYNNESITRVWSGAQVILSEQPYWSDNGDVKGKCTKVVIEQSFSNVRPTSCIQWFLGFTQLNTIEGLRNLNTSEVISMQDMFANCGKLTALDLSQFNTSNVTNMGGMFFNCSTLTSLDLSTFDTSKVDNMKDMFSGCKFTIFSVSSGWTMENVTTGHNEVFTNFPATTFNIKLLDNGDSSNLLETFAPRTSGKTVNVTLQDRKLYRDGDWNTICLPFNASVAPGSALADGILKELVASTSGLDADGKLTLTFTTVTDKTIVAGKPYLIKWETADDNIVNPEFNGVTLSSTTPTAVEFTNGKNATAPCKFVGQYGLFDITSENINTIVMLGSNNMIGYSNVTRQLRPMRAHFEIPLATPQSAPAMIDYEIDFDGEATGVISTTNFSNFTNSDDVWYDLQGRKVNAQWSMVNGQLPKGVYIHKGRKIFVQ